MSAYAFVSILGGNLATLVVTAWPTPGGARRFGALAVALLAAPLAIALAALTELPARLLHLEALAPGRALVAAGIPAIAVMIVGLATLRRRRTVS